MACEVNGYPVTHKVGPLGLRFERGAARRSDTALGWQEAFAPVGFYSAELSTLVNDELGTPTTSGTSTAAHVTSPAPKAGTRSIRFTRPSGTGNSYVNVATPATLAGTTVSLWFYLVALPSSSSHEVVSIVLTGANPTVAAEVTSTGTLNIVDGSGTQTVATGLSTGTWHQLEIAVDHSVGLWKVAARVNSGTTASHTVSTVKELLYVVRVGNTNTVANTYDFLVDSLIIFDGVTFPGNVTLGQSLRPDAILASSGAWTGILNTGDDDSTTVASGAAILSTFTVSVSDYSPAAGTDLLGVMTEGLGGINGVSSRGSFRMRDGSARLLSPYTTPALVPYSNNVFGGSTGTEYYPAPISTSAANNLRIALSHDTGTANYANLVVWPVIRTRVTSSTVPQALTATLSFTSAQARKAKRVLTATLSFTSAQARKVKKARTAALSFTSAQTRKAKRTVNGTVSFTSAQTRKMKKSVAATLSFTSAQTRKMKKSVAATLSFTSAQTRKAKKLLTASWSSSGAVTTRIAIRKTFGGALSFTSAQAKKVSKPLSATLSFSSANIRRVRKFTAAAGSFSGSLTKRVRKTLTATLGFSGALTQVDVPTTPYSPPGMMWIQRWRRKRRN